MTSSLSKFACLKSCFHLLIKHRIEAADSTVTETVFDVAEETATILVEIPTTITSEVEVTSCP